MLFFWLSKVRDTSQGVPADPASHLGSHAYSGCVMVLVLALLLSIAKDGFSLEALLTETGGEGGIICLSLYPYYSYLSAPKHPQKLGVVCWMRGMETQNRLFIKTGT